MKIAFLKDWHHSINETYDTCDGIIGALGEIAKSHELVIFTKIIGGNKIKLKIHGLDWVFCPENLDLMGELIHNNYDAFICWGSLDRPWHGIMSEFKDKPRVLQFAGGPTSHEFLENFDVICCQSMTYIQDFKNKGKQTLRSFGTNTNTFYHIPNKQKMFDTIYPASFCAHKNLELYARAVGRRGIVVGNWNEPKFASVVSKYGTAPIHRVSSETLNDLYNMSKVTVITCGTNGGAQRCVIESMACGVPVVIMDDHDKCVEFVEGSGFGKVCIPVEQEIREAVNELIEKNLDPKIGIDYVNNYWTHKHQAVDLLCAIEMAKG